MFGHWLIMDAEHRDPFLAIQLVFLGACKKLDVIVIQNKIVFACNVVILWAHC